jgi:hypothetical protein
MDHLLAVVKCEEDLKTRHGHWQWLVHQLCYGQVLAVAASADLLSLSNIEYVLSRPTDR